MEDLIRVGVTDPAEACRIAQRPLDRVVFLRESLAKLFDRTPEHFESTTVVKLEF